MSIEIPRAFVERMLLGPTDDRRQLQDSPILGDVWIAFAREPDRQLDLLITPHKSKTASAVASAIDDSVKRDVDDDPNIAFLQGVVAARLYFDEILSVIVPMTAWWHSPRVQNELKVYRDPDAGPERLNSAIDAILSIARSWDTASRPREEYRFSAPDRYIALAGLVLWAGDRRSLKSGAAPWPPNTTFAGALSTVNVQIIADILIDLFDENQKLGKRSVSVFQISLNRSATAAIARSVPAVKGDAARTLFAVSCKEIAWAVIDSGIDGIHPAFTTSETDKTPRVKKSFDFSRFRSIVSLSNTNDAIRKKNLDALQATRNKPIPKADGILKKLATDAKAGRPVNWDSIEKLVLLKGNERPASDHGTHVAGIIGARKKWQASRPPGDDSADGMCPDIMLYDFRVLAPTLQETEFAIIAALQYIRYLNERHGYITIHGVNLSLSIPHDVRNYACGLTPICAECEKTVDSGIVVVAAAGNRGYHSFETKDGSFEGYAAFSVTDPGNADGVITVGSTHRYSPHTYGVSFFSSRGPTGDGRPKPDLVAPGERICGPLAGEQWGDHDGTSMAAPHVSGAAAMLMARYSELIGQPRRIKRILCESATDLGRERSFQGRGMLDVLRAFQSV